MFTQKSFSLSRWRLQPLSPPPSPRNTMLGASRRSRANRKRHFFVSQRCEAPKNATSTLLLGEGGRQGGDGGEWQELLFSQTPVTCGTCCHIMITPICVRHLLGSPHSCCCLSSREKQQHHHQNQHQQQHQQQWQQQRQRQRQRQQRPGRQEGHPTSQTASSAASQTASQPTRQPASQPGSQPVRLEEGKLPSSTFGKGEASDEYV